ncbi:MAG: acetyl-CoA hydrolase/transferase family protein [Dehalococcoidia bacterium]
MRTHQFGDWPGEFASKLMDAAAAVRLVQDGDRVCVPIGAIVPALSDALWARREEVGTIDVLTCAPAYDPGWFEPGHPRFRVHVDVFNTVVGRNAWASHRVDFISIMFSRRFKEFDERGEERRPADVVFVGVSPPDENGWCSFGVSAWNKGSFARRARTVIAEIIDNLPFTGGDNAIHVSEIDAFVPSGDPPAPRLLRETDVDMSAIAAHVRELIHHGDTIQIGTGLATMPLVTNGAFEGKEALGFHSEISVAGMNQMVMSGQATGEKKTIHRGKYVSTALLARTPEELAFINRNPIYEVYPVEYTNDPRVIAQHDNMVAINNALAVDFVGQVASDSVGYDLWGGPGGQFEFAMGATMSRGGRSITVTPSTTRDGAVSRIVPGHSPGTVVTVPRQVVDYVVTEWGIARLYEKSDRERARELIAVAHPDHRETLRRDAAKIFGVEP